MNSQSEKIPHGWRWVKLKEVGVFKSGGTPSKKRTDYWNGEIPFVTGADITELYISKNNARAFLTREGFDSGKTVVCKAGTVLIVTRTRVGRIGIAQETIGASQDITAFECGDQINQEFLYWYLCRNSDYLVDNSRGSTIQGLTRKFVANIEIPLPPLCEQKRIAGILNQQMAYVEKARKAAEEILEAAQALPGAFLRQAFPAHGDALPAGWKWAKLGDVCEIVSGSTPKTNVTAYWNGTITWITPTDMGKLTTKYIHSSQRAITQTGYASCSTKLIPAGAVIMSTRAPIGHLGIASVPLCTNQGCKTFVPGADVDTEFLYFSLLTYMEDIQALGSGSTFQEVSKTKLSKFEICLPPLTEQKRIAALLNEQMAYVETVRMSAREQLDAINALPAALLRRAFAGGL